MTIEEQQRNLRQQLASRGIRDGGVVAAVERTRRDLFIPEEHRHLAYDDTALPLAAGQTVSQPYIVALMTQELLLGQGESARHDETVLEIGTGSGYQAAILSQLCSQVVTVERIPELSRYAQQILEELGYENIEFFIGDGTLGCPPRAPYDGIIVTAAAPNLPEPLYRQLKPGGRLVIPIGDSSIQELTVWTKTEPEPTVRNVCACRFVKLIGEAGWQR